MWQVSKITLNSEADNFANRNVNVLLIIMFTKQMNLYLLYLLEDQKDFPRLHTKYYFQT